MDKNKIFEYFNMGRMDQSFRKSYQTELCHKKKSTLDAGSNNGIQISKYRHLCVDDPKHPLGIL